MEDFLKRDERLVRPLTFELLEKRCHSFLPFFIYFGGGHAFESLVKIWRLKVADEKAVVPKKE